MAFNYPAKPWKDGQEIKITLGGREVVIAKYDASKNLWTHLRVNNAGEFNYVYSCDVIIDRDKCPQDPCLTIDSLWENQETVQGALDWLYLHIFGEDAGILDRLEALEASQIIQDQQIEELYKLLLSIDGLDDVSSLIERIIRLEEIVADHEQRIKDIEAQLPVYADEVKQGTRPDDGFRQDDLQTAIDGSSLPDYVVPGTQQETNYTLFDLRDRKPIISSTPPVRHPEWPEDALKQGDLWIDGSNIMYYWDDTNTVWVEVLDSDHYGDKYVKKTGDTMTGELVMDNAGIIIEEGHIAFNRVGTDVELSDVENRFSEIKSVAPVSTDTNTFDYSKRFGIKIDLDGGNTYKNNFVVGNRNGDIVHVTGGTGPQIILGGSEFTGAPGASGLTSGVPILGVPTPSFEDSPGDIAVNKEYVDERDNILQQEIIELEEEIEAIAPSVERGSWNFTLSGIISGPGVFTAFDEYVATAGAPIGLVTNIKSIWFHSIDNAGTPHGFDNVEPGNLLELFVEGKAEYGLFEVVEVHDYTGGMADYWVIDVDFVRTLENTTRFDNSETCRLKIFQAPEGGTADGFVLKSGDTMSGDLAIDRGAESDAETTLKLTGSRDNTTNASATIAFENSQSPTLGYLTYRSYGGNNFFKFNQDLDLGSQSLTGVDHIELKNGGYIGSGDKPRIRVRNGGGSNNQAGTDIQRPGDGMRTFAIKGKPAGSSNVEDFFWSYGNTGNGGDAINYTGLTTAANHIATKGYVDSKMPTYKITQTNGNYYVS